MSSSSERKAARGEISTSIVEHATRLFAARGYVGASLHDIAQAVGIRKPSLLYHFRSKEDLRRTVLEQLLKHWGEVIPRIMAAASGGQAQFDAIAEETVAFFAENPDRARIILRELLDRAEDVSSLADVHVRPWARIMSEEIKKGQGKGHIHPDVDPEAWVVAMINMVLASAAIHASLASFAATQEPRSPSAPAPERLTREMMRLARASLFREPHNDPNNPDEE